MAQNDRKLIFVTLGPEGTNHEMIAKQYIAYRGVARAQIVLVDDFEEALDLVARGQADYLLICAVHPQCAPVVGRGSFAFDVHICDVFIAPSQPLAILTRKDVEVPRTLALQPATSSYTDISAWPEKVPVSSIMRIAQGLLDGEYDSGLTVMRLAEEHPDRLRIDRKIGSPDDAWIVLGRERVSDGGLVGCQHAPIVKFLGG